MIEKSVNLNFRTQNVAVPLFQCHLEEGVIVEINVKEKTKVFAVPENHRWFSNLSKVWIVSASYVLLIKLLINSSSRNHLIDNVSHLRLTNSFFFQKSFNVLHLLPTHYMRLAR